MAVTGVRLSAAGKVIGTNACNTAGEKLGSVYDLMLDKVPGKAACIVSASHPGGNSSAQSALTRSPRQPGLGAGVAARHGGVVGVEEDRYEAVGPDQKDELGHARIAEAPEGCS